MEAEKSQNRFVPRKDLFLYASFSVLLAKPTSTSMWLTKLLLLVTLDAEG
jgi:hypothetical protein